MARLIFISHPEVIVDPAVPIPDWGLSDTGRARAASFAKNAMLQNLAVLWSSPETKARDTAAILSADHEIPVQFDPRLAENDRSATGFLAPDQFERTADAFFAHPTESIQGWETAKDAQSRITGAIHEITKTHGSRDIAVVSHGAVGTLLYCKLRGVPISRDHDQSSQGHYWTADLATLSPLHPWRRF